ncbi:MAG: TolC family protein [Saprospiraceae bacterium]
MNIKILLLPLILLMFNSLNAQVDNKKWSVEDCIKYAQDSSLTVKNAYLDLQSSKLNYEQAKRNILPDVSGTARQSLSNGQSIDPITSDFVNQQILSTNFAVSSSMALYQGIVE